MKRFYLTLFIAFLGGQLMAQASVANKEKSTNKEVVKTSAAVISSTQPVDRVGTIQANKGIELSGFPVYQNTGNMEVDDANYTVAKENWISKNRSTYDAYLLKLSSESSGNFKDLPGFPQYINTGNETNDIANYLAAKEKWISLNQDLYNTCINSK